MMPQYDTSAIATSAIESMPKSFTASEVWVIISVILAVFGGILIFTAYLGKEKEESYTGYKKSLYDFLNFKITIIEPIFKVLYFIVAIAITLSSFSLISSNFFGFIGVLVFGNLAARIAFEVLLLIFRLIKEVDEINEYLKNNSKDSKNKR